MTAAAHNRVLRAAEKRAALLEPKLAAVLRPILEQAGRDAARRFRAAATDHLTASARKRADWDALGRWDGSLAAVRPYLTAAADGVTSSSTMVCVKPRPEEASQLADPAGTASDTLHVTLAYLGEVDGDLAPVLDALRAVAAAHAPLSGTVAGYGVFAGEAEAWPAILLPDVPGLVELRVAATEALQQAGIGYSRDHGFAAHITLDYVSPGGPDDDGPFRPDQAGAPLHFDDLLVVRGDVEVWPVPLVGVPPVTAAGPPPWTPPAGDEVVDTGDLARSLRGKTDPVRQAVVRTVAGKTLEQAGISFDATNPLIAGALAKTGAHIQGIADTTRADVMRVVGASYEAGLSIPDTAAAIGASLLGAAADRATTIARTELAGAVNGSSLAATQVVASVTGDGYQKTWLTAPGAHFPRHELDPDLEGQTVGLEEYFDVGGAGLMYPGDPDGPPEEVINCFPAETSVEIPFLRAAMRRWYDGDLIHIRLSDGGELAATPNHPVLGADGVWTPIGELEQGDCLVSARHLGGTAGTPDPERPPAEIGETYRLADIAGDPKRVTLSPPDLHGDGSDGEIEVVALDGSLLFDGQAASDEEVMEFGFTLAAFARFRVCGGNIAEIVDSRRRYLKGKASGVISGTGEVSSLPFRETVHAQAVRLGSTPHWDAHGLQVASNDSSAYAHLLGDPEDGFPASMSLPKVTEIERKPFHGYVYNLDTGVGWYTAGTIVCRNCRCAMSYAGQQVEGDDLGG